MGRPESIALAELYDDMQAAREAPKLHVAMGRFVSRVGFDWFGYVAKSPGETYGHSSYPAAWESLYIERRYVEIDPVVQAAQKEPLAFKWDSVNRNLSRVQRNFLGAAADFNVRSGVTVPIVGVYGQFAALSLAGHHNDNVSTSIADSLSYLTLASLNYHMHCNRVRELARAENPVPGSKLTSRAKMCVTWIARGKTIEESAIILNVHEATVRYHLNEARRRLEATSLPHLVAVALQKGEIVF